jgi:hypothetical protein
MTSPNATADPIRVANISTPSGTSIIEAAGRSGRRTTNVTAQ